ncbi:MAG: hypothetical protein KAR45_17125 [Desulfobacteraceae bacterium]|nr:hypothetical protein [Desulfobacteraceae bacterium]
MNYTTEQLVVTTARIRRLFTDLSLFGQIRKVSSDTLAFVYTFPPQGYDWTFTNWVMTMPVTPVNHFLKNKKIIRECSGKDNQALH